MRLPFTVAAVILAIPALVYAADKLNVKLGLWEITTVSQTSGTPPLPKDLLERMTPEQRAQFDAAIGAQAGGRTDVRKACITARDLEHPFTATDDKSCKSTVVSGSSSSQEIRMECSGEHRGDGTLRITMPTPERMNGDLNMQVGEGENGLKVKVDLKGKWLRESCEGADAN